jgi:hypothetical protein
MGPASVFPNSILQYDILYTIAIMMLGFVSQCNVSVSSLIKRRLFQSRLLDPKGMKEYFYLLQTFATYRRKKEATGTRGYEK